MLTVIDLYKTFESQCKLHFKLCQVILYYSKFLQYLDLYLYNSYDIDQPFKIRLFFFILTQKSVKTRVKTSTKVTQIFLLFTWMTLQGLIESCARQHGNIKIV